MRGGAVTVVLAVAALGLTACSPPTLGEAVPVIKTVPADAVRIDEGEHPDQMPEETTAFGDDAFVIMPHAIVTATESAVVTGVTADVAARYGFTGPVQATAGYELVLAVIEAEDGPAGEGAATISLSAGSTTLELTESFDGADEVAVMVSVEQGADVQVRIQDEKREVGLDLRTGARVDVGETSGYYGPGTRTPISGELVVSVTGGVENPAYEAWIPTDTTTLRLTADEDATLWRLEWLEYLGWADDGEDFLVFAGLIIGYEKADTSCRATLSASGSLTLSADGGDAIIEREVDDRPWLTRGGALVFSVPEGTEQVTLTLDPDWRAREGCVLSEDSGAATLDVTLGSG